MPITLHKYSRVHISSDSLFSKILKKPSIVQKKNYTSCENQGFCHWIFKKKKSKSKWPTKKAHFPAPLILNIFSWNSHGLVLGLVELIDAKGIGLAQPVWS